MRHRLGLATRTQISVCKSPFPSAGTAVSLLLICQVRNYGVYSSGSGNKYQGRTLQTTTFERQIKAGVCKLSFAQHDQDSRWSESYIHKFAGWRWERWQHKHLTNTPPLVCRMQENYLQGVDLPCIQHSRTHHSCPVKESVCTSFGQLLSHTNLVCQKITKYTYSVQWTQNSSILSQQSLRLCISVKSYVKI